MYVLRGPSPFRATATVHTINLIHLKLCQKDDFGGRNTIGLQLNKGHLSAGRFPKTCISLHTLQAGKQLHRICPREKPDYPSS
ncbi:hypothetical protein PGT21_034422 [Puccinia graminis f. sp. tritici]|uniref:Uncharacterized protein n=1 Tax=Puccinia graminis f. sp. tritici TaxID=56615 RepID=A0A5B0MQK1_PUCGR|nr:hypothetical protein PGT21_034422 [Puccinia graminis f. sp. tritici]